MFDMFSYASMLLERGLSTWDVNSVNCMRGMLVFASSFHTDLFSWDTTIIKMKCAEGGLVVENPKAKFENRQQSDDDDEDLEKGKVAAHNQNKSARL